MPESEPSFVGHPLYKEVPIQDSRNQTGFLCIEIDDTGHLGGTSIFCSCPEDARYYALSYTWDHTGRMTAWRISGFDFMVSESLLFAVKKICSHLTRGSSFNIWIDAICINQESAEERNCQVSMMARIYSAASRVVVWLGESNGCTEKTIHSLQRLQNFQLNNDEDDEPKISAIVHRSEESITDSSLMQGLTSLYTRPWWTRTWILQEFLFSREQPLIACGESALSWEDLCHGTILLELFVLPKMFAANLTNASNEAVELHNALHRTFIRDLAGLRNLYNIQRKQNLGTVGVPLYDLTHLTRGSLSSNPRDKIYGLLGLLDINPAPILNVDYNKPVEQVYLEATKYMIRARHGFQVLSRAPGVFFQGFWTEERDSYNTPRLPIDETAEGPETDYKGWPTRLPTFQEHSLEFQALHPPLVGEIDPRGYKYDASAGMYPMYAPMDDDNRSLCISGIVIDEIVEIMEGMSCMMSKHQSSPDMTAMRHLFSRAGTPDANRSGNLNYDPTMDETVVGPPYVGLVLERQSVPRECSKRKSGECEVLRWRPNFEKKDFDLPFVDWDYSTRQPLREALWRTSIVDDFTEGRYEGTPDAPAPKSAEGVGASTTSLQ